VTTTRPLDVIGDVHGQAAKLEDLLRAMGYRRRHGVWSHPEHQAVFVGDLIDRGPGQIETVRIVRDMVEAGAAGIVMGNHEFNALSWATEHPERPGHHLRTRHGERGARNRRQHRAFLEAFAPRPSLLGETLAWFRSIPLWLDLGNVRFVHACWSTAAQSRLDGLLGEGNVLSDELLVRGNDPGTPEFDALETLLKGPEIDLPAGYAYHDKDGNHRIRARYAWWDPRAGTYRSGAIVPHSATDCDGRPCRVPPDTPVNGIAEVLYGDTVPLFVGHYWRGGTPAPLSPHVACVDYSAGAGGPLVAYRWQGEQTLTAEHFVTT